MILCLIINKRFIYSELSIIKQKKQAFEKVLHILIHSHMLKTQNHDEILQNTMKK